MEAEKFVLKYSKVIIICLFVLFCFKSIQSCMRDSKITKMEKQYVKLDDSLNTVINSVVKKYEIEVQKREIFENAYNQCNTNLFRSTGKNVVITNNIRNTQPLPTSDKK